MVKKIRTYSDLITNKNTKIPNIDLSSKAIRKIIETEPTLTIRQFKKRIGDM